MVTAAPVRAGRRGQPGAWATALCGMVSLAVAMGIGRFAFTPLLPMMLHERTVDLPTASWLASANYLAYMLGALLCTLQPWIWSRFSGLPSLTYSSIVRYGLAATGLLTLAMALPLAAIWPSLRFGAGIASAVVFVFTTGWCLARLARLGASALGGVIFAGPGVGIVVSGLFGTGMVAWGWTAAIGWLIFGVLALVLTAVVWRIFQGGEERLVALHKSLPPAVGDSNGDDRGDGSGDGRGDGRGEISLLALAYGLAGFGYIVTATFLPVIARQSLPESAWLDLFWPIFGCGVVMGALLATTVPAAGDRRVLLAGAYIIEALGISAGLLFPSLPGFAIGSLMIGFPFTTITYFAMQEVRRLRPASAASFMGLLTVTYGIGQIVGPPLVAVLLAHSATASEGFNRSLLLAMSALVAGTLLYVWMIRRYPIAKSAGG